MRTNQKQISILSVLWQTSKPWVCSSSSWSFKLNEGLRYCVNAQYCQQQPTYFTTHIQTRWPGANQRQRKEAVETEACSFQVLLTTRTTKQLRVDSAELTLSETCRHRGHRAAEYFQLSYPQRSTEPISPNQLCSVSWTSFCSKDI